MSHSDDCALTHIAHNAFMDYKWRRSFTVGGGCWSRNRVDWWDCLGQNGFPGATRTGTLVHDVSIAEITSMLGTVVTHTVGALQNDKAN